MTDQLGHVLVWLRHLAEFGRQNRPAWAVDWRYASVAELLLDEGRVFLPQASPPPARWVREDGDPYVTAALWSAGADLPYVEGLAASRRQWWGTEHGWVAGAGDIALDAAWSEPGEGLAYVGLPVAPAYRRRIEANVLLSAEHAGGRALLAGGLPEDARVHVGLPVPPDRD